MNTNATREIPADGSLLSCDANGYTVSLYRATNGGGFTLRVTAGPTEYSELAEDFTDETLARSKARSLVVGLRKGVSIWKFIGDKRAAQQHVDDVLRFVEAQGKPKLDAVTGPSRNISHLAAAPTSDPMARIIAAAASSDGTIPRGGHGDLGEATITQLFAMKKRGLVEIVRNERKAIVGGRLTAKGWKYADVEQRSAAA